MDIPTGVLRSLTGLISIKHLKRRLRSTGDVVLFGATQKANEDNELAEHTYGLQKTRAKQENACV